MYNKPNEWKALCVPGVGLLEMGERANAFGNSVRIRSVDSTGSQVHRIPGIGPSAEWSPPPSSDDGATTSSGV